MKILYLSAHSVLEYYELDLLTELDNILPDEEKLNIEVFSMGAFSNPTQSGDYLRSVIPKGRFYPELYQLYMQCDKDNIHDELLDWADVVLFMHNSAVPGQKEQQRWVVRNWKKIKERNIKTIWRSIGQSTPAIEEEMKNYRNKGMSIVRYSPLEDKIPGFAGSDALIRFSMDQNEFNNWQGDKQQVITVAQSFKQRGDHLGFSTFDKVTSNFKRKIFGTENEDLGEDNGGRVSFQHLKNELKENRVFFYFGTKPAPYTLSIMEAMMTGIPVVAVGPKLRGDMESPYKWPHYEVPDIISNGVNGFISDNIEELKSYIHLLFDDKDRAIAVGAAGRETAIKLWGKEQRMREWGSFLRKL